MVNNAILKQDLFIQWIGLVLCLEKVKGSLSSGYDFKSCHFHRIWAQDRLCAYTDSLYLRQKQKVK